jgi:hypothetical protein
MKCTECGNDFRPNTTWQHFCSPHCRNKHNNRDYREAQRAFEITASGDVIEVGSKLATAIREIVAKRPPPAPPPTPRRKFRPLVPKAELWTKEQCRELSKLADDWMKSKTEAA